MQPKACQVSELILKTEVMKPLTRLNIGVTGKKIAAFNSSYRFDVHRNITVEHHPGQELPKAAFFCFKR